MQKLFYDEYVERFPEFAKQPSIVVGKIPTKAEREAIARSLQWQASMIEKLRQARIYVLDSEAVGCIEATIERLPAPLRFDPVVPDMWIELTGDDIVIVDDSIKSKLAVHGIHVYIGRDGTHRCDFLTDRGRIQIVFPTETTYALYQEECDQTACPFTPQETRFFEGATALGVQTICSCAQTLLAFAKFMSVLMQFLRAEGVEHTWVEQTVVPRGARKARKNGNLPLPKATKWVKVSLSRKIHIVRKTGRLVNASEAETVDIVEQTKEPDGELRAISTHARLLIPGPGKPWRGDTPRIVWVRGHYRRVYGGITSRYNVQE
ncbi:MAG: hypothetical protein H0U76_12280 [Ktedonobacteraceae bacterium]|nr:hypothetical protein [Ktedonobacteraceae bacterium]MBA3822470.1 hypothetical protein [Ktedonobacterales bacterium]